MMFLQFFIWGAWYVTIGNYMTKLGMADITHWAYTASPLAAIVAPFFLGMVADRYFSAQKVLGVLHLGSGITLLMTPMFSDSPTMFLSMLFIHMLFYMPTLGLTSSIAFQNIENQEKQFPVIRVFGTIGWIVAGVFVSAYLHADETPIPLYTGGAAAILLGLYSFSLPNTPPKVHTGKATIGQILGFEALSKLTGKPFWTFIISSFLISIPLAAYYNFAPIFVNSSGISDPAFKMSFGQMSEAAFLIVMPLFFRFLGVKKMLLVGMAAWVLRYLMFSMGAPSGAASMILVGIALHGICYDFFFVTGQIYVDRKSGPEIRSQAQGFFVFATYGVGMLIGAQVAGALYNHFLAGGTSLSPEQWKDFWLVPSIFALLVLIYFGLQFNDKSVESK
jgi:nucleoside transporter